jgi:exodeoxyribonuclease-5
VLAVIGKAGSGKTLLLAELVRALEAAGVEIISGDWEGRRRKDRRTMAVLAPTNKAASVLRARGVPATTIHRILYTPVYDPEFEKVAEWLAGQGERPVIEALTDAALDRAKAVYETTKSVPAALASAGLRGSDFITGWKRRDSPLDIGLVDESSMLDDRQFEDLTEIFPRWCCSATPRSWRRWGSRARWCSTGSSRAAAGAEPHSPAGGGTTRSSTSPMRWATRT